MFKILVNKSGEHFYLLTSTGRSASGNLNYDEASAALNSMDAVLGNNLSPASFLGTMKNGDTVEAQVNETKAKQVLGLDKLSSEEPYRMTTEKEKELDQVLAPHWSEVFDGKDTDFEMIKSILKDREPATSKYVERAKGDYKSFLLRMADASKIMVKGDSEDSMDVDSASFAKFIRSASDQQLFQMKKAVASGDQGKIASVGKDVMGEKFSANTFKDARVSGFFINLVDSMKVADDLLPEDRRQMQLKDADGEKGKADADRGATSDEFTGDDVAQLEDKGVSDKDIEGAPTEDLKEELEEDEKEYFPDDIVEATLTHPDNHIRFILLMEAPPADEKYSKDDKTFIAKVVMDPSGVFDTEDIEYVPTSKIKRLVEGGAERVRKLSDPEENLELGVVYASGTRTKKAAVVFLKNFLGEIKSGKLAVDSTDLPTLMRVYASRKGMDISAPKRAFVSENDNVRIISDEQMLQGKVTSVDDKSISVDLDSGGTMVYSKVIGPDLRWSGDVTDGLGKSFSMKKVASVVRITPEVSVKTAGGRLTLTPRMDGVAGSYNGESLGRCLPCSINRIIYNVKTSAAEQTIQDVVEMRNHWPLYEIPGLEGDLNEARVLDAKYNGYVFFVTKSLPTVIWVQDPNGRIEHYSDYMKPVSEEMLNNVVMDMFLQKNLNSVFASERFDPDFVKYKTAMEKTGTQLPVSTLKQKYASERSKFHKGELVHFFEGGVKVSGLAWEDRGEKISVMTGAGERECAKAQLVRKSQVTI